MAPSMKPMQMTIAACVDERPTASLAASNVGPKISRLATSRRDPSFFEPNPFAFLSAHHPLGKDKAGFYSTAPLEKTLTDLVEARPSSTTRFTCSSVSRASVSRNGPATSSRRRPTA
jgi:hypothetical protein